jgi:hypothetical protein
MTFQTLHYRRKSLFFPCDRSSFKVWEKLQPISPSNPIIVRTGVEEEKQQNLALDPFL